MIYNFVLAHLSYTSEGITAIAHMRQTNQTMKNLVDDIVLNSCTFRGAFLCRPLVLRAFVRQTAAVPRLHEIFFRMHPVEPKFPLEHEVFNSMNLISVVNCSYKNDSPIDVSTFDVGEYHLEGTALHYACLHNTSTEHIELLLANGAELDQPTTQGTTPLACAVQGGHTDLVAFLLKKGANPNGIEWCNKPPLFWSKSSEIRLLLLEYGAKPIKTLLDDAASLGDTEFISELIKKRKIPVDSTSILQSKNVKTLCHFQQFVEVISSPQTDFERLRYFTAVSEWDNLVQEILNFVDLEFILEVIQLPEFIEALPNLNLSLTFQEHPEANLEVYKALAPAVTEVICEYTIENKDMFFLTQFSRLEKLKLDGLPNLSRQGVSLLKSFRHLKGLHVQRSFDFIESMLSMGIDVREFFDKGICAVLSDASGRSLIDLAATYGDIDLITDLVSRHVLFTYTEALHAKNLATLQHLVRVNAKPFPLYETVTQQLRYYVAASEWDEFMRLVFENPTSDQPFIQEVIDQYLQEFSRSLTLTKRMLYCLSLYPKLFAKVTELTVRTQVDDEVLLKFSNVKKLTILKPQNLSVTFFSRFKYLETLDFENFEFWLTDEKFALLHDKLDRSMVMKFAATHGRLDMITEVYGTTLLYARDLTTFLHIFKLGGRINEFNDGYTTFQEIKYYTSKALETNDWSEVIRYSQRDQFFSLKCRAFIKELEKLH